MKYLVIDTMGVLYDYDCDSEGILIPFIKRKNLDVNSITIKKYYFSASRGEILPETFWKSVGLTASDEEEYLEKIMLSKDAILFLGKARRKVADIFCLSNDLSSWSEKLRKRFDLDLYISRWFISDVLGCRKPDITIYNKMLKQLRSISPEEIIFVDDQEENLKPAAEVGLQTYLFTGNRKKRFREFICLESLYEILDFL